MKSIRRAACHLLLVFVAVMNCLAADVTEPKPGTPERTAIMEAMRGPISKQVGKPVIFTGQVKVSGDWATFLGGVAPKDGKAPKGDVAELLEMDFFALLRRVKGEWVVGHSGFAGDVSVMQDARKKFPRVPKELVPDFDQ